MVHLRQLMLICSHLVCCVMWIQYQNVHAMPGHLYLMWFLHTRRLISLSQTERIRTSLPEIFLCINEKKTIVFSYLHFAVVMIFSNYWRSVEHLDVILWWVWKYMGYFGLHQVHFDLWPWLLIFDLILQSQGSYGHVPYTHKRWSSKITRFNICSENRLTDRRRRLHYLIC